MAKRVKVTLELTSSFVRMLQASVQLKGWLGPHPDLDPVGTLAVAVLGEARGALPEEVEDKIPSAFLGDIRVLHHERTVTEDPPKDPSSSQ